MNPKEAVEALDHVVHLPKQVNGYEVQWVMPEDNPVVKMSISRKQKLITFYVPVNLPDANRLGYTKLLHLAKAAELSTVSTPP